MSERNLEEQLRARARALGFDACRFTTAAAPETASRLARWLAEGRQGEMSWMERSAARRADPGQVLAGARSIISLAVSYAASAEASPGAREPTRSPARGAPGLGGEIARYARHADYHDTLAGPLQALAEAVQSAGGAETRARWYVDTGPVLERDLAERAGLGFIGKHTNLISRSLGNWFFLAEIITTLELRPDPPEHNRCGSCVRCLAACPTAAITAPFELDARRCISYLTIELKGPIPAEFRPAIGRRIFGCDDCLAACPWNRFARAGRLMQSHARPDLDQPDLLELLALDEPGFRARFANTPILRSKRRGLLRNVCVALGNIGDAGALPALAAAAADPEPLIAEHARWALEQIRRRGGS